jgi:hypothetical protein
MSPDFGITSKPFALTLMGSTQGMEIIVTGIKNNCTDSGNSTTIFFKCSLIDTFGAGLNDACTYKQIFPGLPALCILQHYRNDEDGNTIPKYVPVLHYIEFQSPITF